MNLKKKLILVLVFVLVLTSLIGCAGNDNQEDTVKQLSVGGAGTAGTFYIMAAGISDVISKQLGINSVAEVTGGSVENLKLIGDKKIELGVTQVDVAQNALKGLEQFDKITPVTALIPMYPNVVQVITLKDSTINSFSDLKGKRISVGSPGSGILATNEVILNTLGLSLEDIEPQYLSFAETTDAFRDGSIDAAIVNTAAPSSFVVDLETSHPIKLISLTNEEISKFTSEPYYVEAEIEKGTYNSLEQNVPTFAVWITLVSDPDLPEETVYDVVKTIFENGDNLKDIHAVSKYVLPENAKNIGGIPFHPGAAKYYKELGIDVPVK